MAFGVPPSSSCQKAIKLMTGEKKKPSVLVSGDSIFNKRTFTTCREKEKKKSGIFLVNLYLGDKI